MKKSFAELPRPVLVGSIRQRNTADIISDITKSASEGAKAFIVHIQLMDESQQNFKSFKDIADSTECPIMAINYTTKNGPCDEKRIETMREAVRAGFRSVDIPANTYDSEALHEVSLCTDAIAKQRILVSELKSLGAEVLISAHTGIEHTVNEVVTLALDIQSRGADIVKIVSSCNSKEQQIEILRGNMALESAIDVPFLYTCGGKLSRFIRFNAPLFGTMLVFGHSEYKELSNKEKPRLRELKEYYESSNYKR